VTTIPIRHGETPAQIRERLTGAFLAAYLAENPAFGEKLVPPLRMPGRRPAPPPAAPDLYPA